MMDRKYVKEIIRKQTDRCFTPEDIGFQAKVSASSAYLIIRELIGMGEVIIDHKDGHRIYYGLKDKSGMQVPAENNILSLAIEERFQYIGGVTDMVINGISPSAFITGMAGIGKTYLVRNRLKQQGKIEGKDYHFVSGHSSPMGLYMFLYEHRDAICVFDDCDSIFKDSIAVNLLKSAIDSYEVRTVNWQSSRMPDEMESSFDFEGSIIFISNLDESRIDEAVKSRTFVIDLQLNRKEIVDYMRKIAKDVEPEMSLDEKHEVIDYLDKTKDNFKQFNLRTLIKVARIKRGSKVSNIDWKKMALVLD